MTHTLIPPKRCTCCARTWTAIPDSAQLWTEADAAPGWYWPCPCGKTQYLTTLTHEQESSGLVNGVVLAPTEQLLQGAITDYVRRWPAATCLIREHLADGTWQATFRRPTERSL